MLAYIILLLLILLLGLTQYSSNGVRILIGGGKILLFDGKLFSFISIFIVMAILQGARGVNVGEDLKGYLSWMDLYKSKPVNMSTMLDFSAFEPGFIWIYKMSALFNDTNKAFIVITSVAICGLNLYYLYKQSSDFYLSVLLYLGFNHFFTSMVSLRQYFAIAIVMWLIPLLSNRSYFKATIICLLAFYFHQTSIIASFFIVGAYFLRKHDEAILPLLIATICISPFANILFAFFTKFFSKYSLNYSTTDYANKIGYIRMVYVLLQFILIVYIHRFKKDKDECYTMYSILMIPAIACGIITTIPWLFRIGYYFDYVMLLLIPKLVSESGVNKKGLRIIVAAIAIVFFLYYLTINPGETVPYELYQG